MNKRINDSKGITLLALVITIVVLIILSGISINVAIGDNGLIGKANKAKSDTEYSEKKEQVDTAIAQVYVNKKGRNIKPSHIVSQINNDYKENVRYSTSEDSNYYNTSTEISVDDDKFPGYIIYPDDTKIVVTEDIIK